MKVLIINFGSKRGGASQSAHRLFKSLLANNIESKMLIKNYDAGSLDPKLYIQQENWLINFYNNLLNAAENLLLKILGKPKNNFSYSIFGSFGIAKMINDYDPDIVNLHWVAGNMLSVNDIRKIKAPIVWTIHDHWPFSNGYHVPSYHLDGTNDSSDVKKTLWFKYKKWILSFKNDLTVVSPSKWIGNIAKSSEIFELNDHYHIPNLPKKNYLNFNHLADKNISKKVLKEKNIVNLPIDKKVISFGAMNPISDKNKGFDLLHKAWMKVDSKNFCLHLFGINNNDEAIYCKNIIPDAATSFVRSSICAETYGASDLVVVPSYQENLSNSIYEALSCGRPVVAFDIGGNNELIDHKINGYLAQPYDEEDLANGIKWVLNYANQKELEENARNKILKKFSHEHLLEDYLNLFASICKRSNNEDKQTI